MRKRWISLLLVFALVLAVWSVCAVAADAQKADRGCPMKQRLPRP